MDATTAAANRDARPAAAETPANTRAAPRRKSGRWLRGTGGDGHAGLVEELEAEVALLREENARLKIRGAREAARPREERPRETAPEPSAAADAGDTAWELIMECQVLRTALDDACRDLDTAIQRLRGQLDAHVSARPKVTS